MDRRCHQQGDRSNHHHTGRGRCRSPHRYPEKHLRRRRFSPRIQTASDQFSDKTYWVDLPMGTASTARALIAEQSQHEISLSIPFFVPPQINEPL